jgi:hypothetical protein
MDDSLEIPTAHLPTTPLGDAPPEGDDERSSDEEDGGLDWTKLPQVAFSFFVSSYRIHFLPKFAITADPLPRPP